MMSLKEGAKVNGIQPEIILAFVIAEKIYESYGLECVLTEATGGTHSSGSLHYVGFAIDLRTWGMTDSVKNAVVNKLKVGLGSQYDVVLEKDHIHIEFQPKSQ